MTIWTRKARPPLSREVTPGPGARVGALMVGVQPLYIVTELLTAATVINSSFVVFGVLLAVGALLLRTELPSGAAARTSVVLWVIAGLSSIATGLVPLDQHLALHAVVSFPVFLAQPLAILTTAWAVPGHPGLARSGLAVGLVTLAAALAYLGAPATSDVGGLLERLALWPGYLWLPVLAVAVVRRRPPPRPASRTV